VGAPPESVPEAISGFDALHRVAQSYLGPLWIAVQARDGGSLRLLRRLQLPDKVSSEGRRAIITLGQNALALDHPNVLRVLDVVDQGEVLAFAYEHAEAEPLRSLQSWANLRGLSFPVGVALRILVDLLSGVAAMHAMKTVSPGSSVAGGLSPDSVLVGRNGSTKLCDPLIASGACLLDAIGSNTAKLAYAAPEQVHAVQPPTASADVFTCAAMLWELLASRRLLAGSRPAIERKLLEHNLPGLRASLRSGQQVSDALVGVVERALAADPAERPASAAQLALELSQAGHELAELDEVAAFVGKLSGPRFDRRTAAIRTRTPLPFEDVKLAPEVAKGAPRSAPGAAEPTSDIDTPRAQSAPATERSAEAPRPKGRANGKDRGAAAAGAPSSSTPASSTPASSTPASSTPDTAPASTTDAAPFVPAPIEPPGLGLSPPAGAASGNGALWDTMITQATPPTSSPSPLGAFGNRTMRGLGSPALSLNRPFSNLTPPPFAAPEGAATALTPRAPPVAAQRERAEGASATADAHPVPAPTGIAAAPRLSDPFVAGLPQTAVPDGPLPFAHLLARSKRPSAVPSDPSRPSFFEPHAPVAPGLSAAGRGPSESPGSRGKLWLAASVLVLVLLAAGGWRLLSRQHAETLASAERSAATPPASALPPAEPASDAPKPDAPRGSGSAASAAESPDAGAPTPPTRAVEHPPEPQQAHAADFASAKLDDSQLVVLFALEERASLPSCEERLGDAAGKYSGSDTRRSQLMIKAARRQLAKADARAAHELACSAVAHNPRYAPAQRNLAELALALGDPALAKAAVDKALALAPKDKGLLALRGDVLALMGDIVGSRSTWLRTGPTNGSKAARTKRLVAAYKKLGDKALASSNWLQAATYFRRAVILTHGNLSQSLGLSEALLGLDHSRAALVWAERAAQAQPKDPRVQVLFGDALYENGQAQKARAAWQAALDVQPNSRLAARRLREGKP
jgi:serine/threonine protein kinase/tetratricopeptide (TPR) repeat protein